MENFQVGDKVDFTQVYKGTVIKGVVTSVTETHIGFEGISKPCRLTVKKQGGWGRITKMKDAETLCPDCTGNKVTVRHYAPTAVRGPRVCSRCGGSGVITKELAARIAEGEQLREIRIESGRTLREEAARLGISPRELSDIENGRSETRLRPG